MKEPPDRQDRISFRLAGLVDDLLCSVNPKSSITASNSVTQFVMKVEIISLSEVYWMRMQRKLGGRSHQAP